VEERFLKARLASAGFTALNMRAATVEGETGMAIRFSLDSLTPDLAVAALRDTKRADKAAKIPESDVVPVKMNGRLAGFSVRSQSNPAIWYSVVPVHPGLTKFSCTCPDFVNRGGECKHQKRVRIFLELFREQSPDLVPWFNIY
jgi:hypothetical protein